MLYIFLLYNLVILFLALYIKKKKYFSNYSGDKHQIFSNEKNIPLIGGIFLLIPILSISYHNFAYNLIILSIFILGLLRQSLVISGHDISPAIKFVFPSFLMTLG